MIKDVIIHKRDGGRLMKRDMDLVRTLLLRLEELHIPAGSAYFLELHKPPLTCEGENIDEIAYALRMITDAGFIDLTPTQPALGVGLTGLTWQGHDFLDSVRDPEIWRKTKEGAQKAGGFTLELIQALAKGLIKTQIEKHTGVKL
jgi:hypothetical protein